MTVSFNTGEILARVHGAPDVEAHLLEIFIVLVDHHLFSVVSENTASLQIV